MIGVECLQLTRDLTVAKLFAKLDYRFGIDVQLRSEGIHPQFRTGGRFGILGVFGLLGLFRLFSLRQAKLLGILSPHPPAHPCSGRDESAMYSNGKPDSEKRDGYGVHAVGPCLVLLFVGVVISPSSPVCSASWVTASSTAWVSVGIPS